MEFFFYFRRRGNKSRPRTKVSFSDRPLIFNPLNQSLPTQARFSVIYCLVSVQLKVFVVFSTHVIVIKTNIENVPFSILREQVKS